jgi:hypothetical protein
VTPELDDALRTLARAQRHLTNAQTVRDFVVKTDSPGLFAAVTAMHTATQAREAAIQDVLMAYAAQLSSVQ